MRVDFIGGSIDGKTFEIPENTPEWHVAVLPEIRLTKLKYGTVGFDEYIETYTEIYVDIGHGLFMMTRKRKT